MDLRTQSGLLAAYRRLLTPLVRILIKNKVGYKEFSQLAQSVFAEVGEAALVDKKEQFSDRELSAVCGLSEEQIDRWRSNKALAQDEAGSLDQVTRVLSGWHTDDRFTGPYGLPLELPRKDATTADFGELVERHSPGADADEVLQELIRNEAVVETDSDWFRVLTRTYLPSVDAPDSLEHLGRSVASFVETIDHNRTASDAEERLFERVVDADDGIRAEDLPRLKAYVRDRAQLLLEEIDNWLSQLDEPDNNRQIRKKVRTGLGIYHYVETEEDIQ